MFNLIRVVVLALMCLTVVSADALAQKPKVLLFYADVVGSAQDVKAKLDATGLFAQVDLRDMNTTAPPTIDFLMQYDAVMSWTNYTALSGVGNLLAQYVENGKGVVTAMFAHYATTYTIKENFASSTYQVIVPNTGYTTASSSIGSVLLPTHPLMKNVSTFSASTAFRSISSTLATGAYRVANWASGEPLIAAKENVGAKKARRVDLNFFPPSSTYSSSYWLATTNGGQIMANALLWCAGGGAPPAHMTAGPKTVDFGTRGQNETTQRTVTVGSLGPGTLKFEQI
ncbi:MAG TPA: hypothetical protein VFH43_13070, partial [Candidatus Kapabacteria bacterium]|nr:hypothetical protein [Candidatus Kapabacteria bacterium]